MSVGKSVGMVGILRTLLLDRNVRVIAVTGLVSGVYVGMLNGVLQLFPGTLGFSVAALGIFQALGNRFSGVASSVVQPFAGHYADVHGRRLVILIGSVTTIVSMLLFAGAAVTSNWVLVLAGFVLFGISTLGSHASQAVIAESVGLDGAKMNVAYSAIFLLAVAPGAVTPYVAGVIADRWGYLAIFLIAALLESVDLFLYLKELTETRRDSGPKGEMQERAFSFTEALRLPRGDVGYFGALAMDAFAFGISSSIIYAIVEDRFGFSPADIGLMVAVVSLSVIASQYHATRLLIKIGARKTLILSESLGVVLMGGWVLADSLPIFLLLSVVFGVSISTWVPGVQSMLMSHSAPDERGAAGGKLAAFRGLVAFPAPIVGGVVYQGLGYQAPMVASFVGAIVTVLLMLKYLPKPGEDVATPAPSSSAQRPVPISMDDSGL